MRISKVALGKFWERVLFSDAKYSICIFVGLLLFIGAFFLHTGVLALLLFFTFPFVLLIKPSWKNFMLAAPLVLGLNFLFLIVVASAINILNLPITLKSLLIVSFLGILCSVVINVRLKRRFLEELLNRYNLGVLAIIYILFGMALLSRVFSVTHAPVPILHDPEAHAYWAKRIINEHSINYFYSPGLHIWVAILNLTTHLSLAKAVDILTNTLSSFTVLSWGIAAYVISKNRILAVFAAFFVLIAPLPTDLYFLAGKNALVAALPFFGLLIAIGYKYCKKFSYASAFGISLVLCGIAMLHYPLFVFALAYTGLLILFTSLQTFGVSRFNKLLKRLGKYCLPLLASLLFVGLFIYATNKFTNTTPTVPSNTVATVFHQNAEKTGSINVSGLTAVHAANNKVFLHKPIGAIAGLTKGMFSFVTILTGTKGIILLGFGFVSIYFLANKLITREKELEFSTLSATSIILAFVIIMLCLSIFETNILSTVSETGYHIVFMVLTIPTAMLFAKITRFRFLIVAILLVITGGYFSHNTYVAYATHSNSSFVDSSDLAAYNWINTNYPKDQGFIGSSALGPNRQSIVFPTDGSLWLPVFTNDKISTPFQDSGFVADESHINYEYMRLLSGSYSQQKLAVNYFSQHNYNYIYADGPAAQQQLNVHKLVENGLAKISYSNRQVIIARLQANMAL